MNPLSELYFIFKTNLKNLVWILALFVLGYLYSYVSVTTNFAGWAAALFIPYTLTRQYKLNGDRYRWLTKPYRRYLVGAFVVIALFVAIISATFGSWFWMVQHGVDYKFAFWVCLERLMNPLMFSYCCLLFYSFSSTIHGLLISFMGSIILFILTLNEVGLAIAEFILAWDSTPKASHFQYITILLFLVVAIIYRYSYRLARLTCFIMIVVGVTFISQVSLFLGDYERKLVFLPKLETEDLVVKVNNEGVIKLPDSILNNAIEFKPESDQLPVEGFNFKEQAYALLGKTIGAEEYDEPFIKFRGRINETKLGTLTEYKTSLVATVKLDKSWKYVSDGQNIYKFSVDHHNGQKILFVRIERIYPKEQGNPASRYIYYDRYSLVDKSGRQYFYHYAGNRANFQLEKTEEMSIVQHRPVRRYNVIHLGSE